MLDCHFVQDPKKIGRRLVRVASEDVGLADTNALSVAVAAFQAVTIVGRPEADLALLQCVAYLARAPKSNALEVAYNSIKVVLKAIIELI